MRVLLDYYLVHCDGDYDFLAGLRKEDGEEEEAETHLLVDCLLKKEVSRHIFIMVQRMKAPAALFLLVLLCIAFCSQFTEEKFVFDHSG